MSKRRPSIPAGQFAFSFDPPAPARAEAALAGLDREVSATVALILKEDDRDRYAIAADMSRLLDDEITKPMLDGYFRYSWRARMAQRFPRAKLTDDVIAAVRAETIAIAREWGEAELMEDVDGFIDGLVIERDATNRTQLNVLMTPDVVNGMLQLAARIEFIL